MRCGACCVMRDKEISRITQYESRTTPHDLNFSRCLYRMMMGSETR